MIGRLLDARELAEWLGVPVSWMRESARAALPSAARAVRPWRMWSVDRLVYQGEVERGFCHPQRGTKYRAETFEDALRAALSTAGVEGRVRAFHDFGTRRSRTTRPGRTRWR